MPSDHSTSTQRTSDDRRNHKPPLGAARQVPTTGGGDLVSDAFLLSPTDLSPSTMTTQIVDPFQCRLTFTRQISNLSASAVAAKQAAQFALKNRDVDEDLFSVILEQLQAGDCTMNVRVNVLYFIESLCEQSLKADYVPYVSMVQRDLGAIVDAVASDDHAGATNAEAVKKVLHNLYRKGIVEKHRLQEMTDFLSEREAAYKAAENSSDETMSGDEEVEEDAEQRQRKKRRRFSDSIIQQRMEEDRERHKRLRENIWAVLPAEVEEEDPEFSKAWDLASDLNDDDYEIMREENEILAASTA